MTLSGLIIQAFKMIQRLALPMKTTALFFCAQLTCRLFRCQYTLDGVDYSLSLRINFDIDALTELFVTKRGALERFWNQMHTETRWGDFANRQANPINTDKSLVQNVFHQGRILELKPDLTVVFRGENF